MKKNKRLLAIIMLPLAILLTAGFIHRNARATTTRPIPDFDATSDKGFAVVELFTSEGCSSCPPADRALAQLADEYPGQVYVLGFHVDYWNRLGWKDIYSDASYTQRQKEYAERFRLESIYTPEAVVNGQKEFVGSDRQKLQSAVKAELAATTNNSLGLTTGTKGNNVTVQYTIKGSNVTTAGAMLHTALVQSMASSQVLGGENRGLSLQHVNVVRDFQSVPLKNAKTSGSETSGKVELTIPGGLTAKDCKVIAYIQDRSAHITAVEATSIQ
jgi:hypothetical protein